MPGKKMQFNFCSRVMLSDNLKRHAQSCMGDPGDFAEVDQQSWSDVAQKRPMSPNMPTSNGSNKSSKLKTP